MFSSLVGKDDSNVNQAFQELKKSLNTVLGFDSTAGIYSLSRTPTEELLWAHYGYSHQGFCIEYDLDTLVEFEKNAYQSIEVKYSDNPLVLSMEDLFDSQQRLNILEKILGAKSLSWGYEKELRVVTSWAGRHDYDFRAVKAIYFGLRMPDPHKQEIMQALKGRGIAYKQIALVTNSYKFTYVDVEDLYKNCEQYKYSVAPIAEYAIAPEYVKDELRVHSDYLYKAAEIVRREPYCNEVENVEFSPSKGTLENPIIYVQYTRKENRSINHYLSFSEIDQQYAQIQDLDK